MASPLLNQRFCRAGQRWRATVVRVLFSTWPLLSSTLVAHASDAWFDRLGDALEFSSLDGDARARISGTLDLEGFGFSQPAPGLIGSPGEALFSPRLTTFLDAQWGEHVYVFVQHRTDRGFDPGRRRLRGRLDEYAVRVIPWPEARFNVQVGKFATIVGNWVGRHGSWDNPFVTAPFAYEQLTGIWDAAAAQSAAELLSWAHVRPRLPAGTPARDKPLRLPLLWGPVYVTGVAMAGGRGRMSFAVELKDASLSSRPRRWDYDAFEFRHPTVAARVGFRPNAMWNFGLSASRGTYLQDDATPTLAPGRGLGDYRQEMLAQDLSFAWHHFQLWAEFFEARFTIPTVGNAEVFSYYVEAKYKFTPQWAGAVRWNEQLYGRISGPGLASMRWGANVRRLDVGPAYRLSAHAQLKFQYSLEHREGEPRAFGHLAALQLTVRF